MRIVLTGGSGFIGSRLIEILTKSKKNELLILTRKKIKLNKNYKIKQINTNLKYLHDVGSKIIKFNPEVLIHLAWDKIPNFNFTNSKMNEINSKRLISFFCKNTNTKHIIVSGSCFEIQSPNNSYKYFVNAKKNILKFLNKNSVLYKIQFTWLRIFYVYGPNQRKGSIIPYLLSKIKEKKIAIINEPNKMHDFIYIDDVCKSILCSIKYSKKSNILEIGSGKVSSIKKIAIELRKISNNQLRYNMNKGSKKNNILKAKVKKAEKEILWKPKINIFQGLNKIFKSF